MYAICSFFLFMNARLMFSVRLQWWHKRRCLRNTINKFQSLKCWDALINDHIICITRIDPMHRLKCFWWATMCVLDTETTWIENTVFIPTENGRCPATNIHPRPWPVPLKYLIYCGNNRWNDNRETKPTNSLIFIKTNFRFFHIPVVRSHSWTSTWVQWRRWRCIRWRRGKQILYTAPQQQRFHDSSCMYRNFRSLWNAKIQNIFLSRCCGLSSAFFIGNRFHKRSHSWFRFTRSQLVVCVFLHRSLIFMCLILIRFVFFFVSFAKIVGTFHQRQWCKRIRLFDCRRCR